MSAVLSRCVGGGLGIVTALHSYGIQGTDHVRVRRRASFGDVYSALRLCVYIVRAVGHDDG